VDGRRHQYLGDGASHGGGVPEPVRDGGTLFRRLHAVVLHRCAVVTGD
jgi:hypothetical protein